MIVSNASSLIALARIERFGLLQSVFGHLCIPQAVYDEIVVKGAGKAGADETREAVGDWIEVLPVKDTAMVRSLLTELGRGESEAIALALETEGGLVLLDDRRARTVAKFMGLRHFQKNNHPKSHGGTGSIRTNHFSNPGRRSSRFSNSSISFGVKRTPVW